MPERSPVDVLMVLPGTTPGWRRVDRELTAVLNELGVSTATASTDFRIAGRFRRGVFLTDLAEAAAMRHALTKALRGHLPRALLFTSTQATMLQPRRRLRGATAVHFDEPAASNRAGFGAGFLHALERRSLGHVRLFLPMGVEPSAEVLALEIDKPMVALPVAIAVTWQAWTPREKIAVLYARNPGKKGLDLAVAAWVAAAPEGWRLVVTGVEDAAGRRHLARHGVAEPAGLEWAGVLTPEAYAELMASAALFVSASRHEDYGLAQLEAFGAGLTFVTLPSPGPFPALAMARSLDARLVARDLSPQALAMALEAGLDMSDADRAAYAERASELLRTHSHEELRRRVGEEVLPVLLGD
jgi:glycosyltransferase involved in cell wall biosynthesis